VTADAGLDVDGAVAISVVTAATVGVGERPVAVADTLVVAVAVA